MKESGNILKLLIAVICLAIFTLPFASALKITEFDYLNVHYKCYDELKIKPSADLLKEMYLYLEEDHLTTNNTIKLNNFDECQTDVLLGYIKRPFKKGFFYKFSSPACNIIKREFAIKIQNELFFNYVPENENKRLCVMQDKKSGAELYPPILPFSLARASDVFTNSVYYKINQHINPKIIKPGQIRITAYSNNVENVVKVELILRLADSNIIHKTGTKSIEFQSFDGGKYTLEIIGYDYLDRPVDSKKARYFGDLLITDDVIPKEALKEKLIDIIAKLKFNKDFSQLDDSQRVIVKNLINIVKKNNKDFVGIGPDYYILRMQTLFDFDCIKDLLENEKSESTTYTTDFLAGSNDEEVENVEAEKTKKEETIEIEDVETEDEISEEIEEVSEEKEKKAGNLITGFATVETRTIPKEKNTKNKGLIAFLFELFGRLF